MHSRGGVGQVPYYYEDEKTSERPFLRTMGPNAAGLFDGA
jgi:hypothetical protein